MTDKGDRMEHAADAERKVKKADILLVGGLLALCAAAFFVFRVATAADGNSITITVDGEEYGTYDLDDPREIPVDSHGRTANVVVIADGAAYMKEADCPDHLCIRQGKIAHGGESIVCLPNRVVVTVSGDDAALDAVAE